MCVAKPRGGSALGRDARALEPVRTSGVLLILPPRVAATAVSVVLAV